LDYALWPFPIHNLTSETYESIFGHLVGLLGQGINPLQGHYLHRTTQYRKMYTHTSMSQAGFEHMIPVFKWMKTVHALDHAAIGTG